MTVLVERANLLVCPRRGRLIHAQPKLSHTAIPAAFVFAFRAHVGQTSAWPASFDSNRARSIEPESCHKTVFGPW
jgi:hypothetical protein